MIIKFYMNVDKLLQYCYTNADRKLDTAKSLFKSKKNSVRRPMNYLYG